MYRHFKFIPARKATDKTYRHVYFDNCFASVDCFGLPQNWTLQLCKTLRSNSFPLQLIKKRGANRLKERG